MDKKEINRLIAEKVMGWKRMYDILGEQHVWKTNDGIRTLFYPAECIEYAWEVFKLFDFGYIEKITGYGERYKVSLSVLDVDGTYCEFEYEAETAPLAIILCALKTVGIEVEVNV